MDLQVIFCLCLALCAGVIGKDLRIIGGESKDIREFPYQASLRFLGQMTHLCGGVIITQKHILSVAHCIFQAEYMYPYIRVFVGIEYLMDFRKYPFSVAEVHVHRRYTGQKTGFNGFHNDIAVYTLSDLIQFNEFQNKINLPEHDTPRNGLATMSGWGCISYPASDPPIQVQKTDVHILEREECSNRFEVSTLIDEICTFQAGASGCIGDSGGPLTRNGTLIGILSFTNPAGRGPNIHINVYVHLPFIYSIINA